MLLWLLILFILIPVLEVALLIWLTLATNLLTTVVLVLSTGFIGAGLARWQGFRAWNTIRADLASGRPSTGAVVEGVLILIAGLLLLTPGLISDATGFLLLIPPVRRLVGRRIVAGLRRRIEVRVRAFQDRAAGQTGEIIDAEYRRADASATADPRTGIDVVADPRSNGQA